MIETEELNEKAEKVEKPENAAAIIKQYEALFAQKRKTSYHQGKFFKRFN